MIKLNVNGIVRNVDVLSDMLLLWVLRDHLGFIGTKFGCGVGLCGVCMVHLNGQFVWFCVVLVGIVKGARIKIIEGLSKDCSHLVQQAWIAEQVLQCGYCQFGMIMVMVVLLERKPKFIDADIEEVVSNICCCGTYQCVKKVIYCVVKV